MRVEVVMQLPKNISDSTRRRNPELFGDAVPAVQLQQGSAKSFGIAGMKPEVITDALKDIKPSTGRRQTIQIAIEPVPAPRMTRRDKWLKPRRPCVQRYFDYREKLQACVGDLPTVPDEVHCQFIFTMPESWSKKKRQEMVAKPHRQRPDFDNCCKAVLDALFLEDGGVWRGECEKRWGVHGSVTLTFVWH
jgi:Holliday junction resolvase RusA-like endonuclease